MLLQTSVASGVWRLLEQVYLDAASELDACNYASLSETEKRATLLAFADTKSTVSKRWASIVADLRAIALAG